MVHATTTTTTTTSQIFNIKYPRLVVLSQILNTKDFLLHGWLPRGVRVGVTGLLEERLTWRREGLQRGGTQCTELNQCIGFDLQSSYLQIPVHWTKPESLQGMATMRRGM
jgi:hypothetical protein